MNMLTRRYAAQAQTSGDVCAGGCRPKRRNRITCQAGLETVARDAWQKLTGL